MVRMLEHEHHSRDEEEILSEEDKAYIREKFEKELVNEVPIKLIISDNCEYCHSIELLLKTLAKLSDGKIKLEIMDMTPELSEKLKVNRGPIVLIGERGEVQYTGAPLGEEGWAFLETISIASNKKHGLESYEKQLKELPKTVRVETIITPTCPYCPHAVLMANRIAIASEGRIVSDTIEAYEFPEIANKWNVTAVPTIVLSVEEPYSGEVFVIGLPREEQLINAILKLARGEQPYGAES